MQNLASKRRLSESLATAGLLSVVSGLLLYWPASSGLSLHWISTRVGMSVTIGGLAGIATFLIGMLVNRPAVVQMGELGARMQAQDGPPDPDTLAEIERVCEGFGRAGIRTAVHLGLAVLGMPPAERLWF